MASKNKRKKKSGSIEDKYAVLRRIDLGEPQAKIPAELEVGTSTVSD